MTQVIGNSADVDGHDVGIGEMNIFVLTPDPVSTFRTVKPVLQRNKYLEKVVVAYRNVEDENYTVIFPADWEGNFNVL